MNKTISILKKRIIADNEELLYFKMREELYALNLLIKNNTKTKELNLLSRKIKSKLPIYRIGLC